MSLVWAMRVVNADLSGMYHDYRYLIKKTGETIHWVARATS